MLFRRSFIFLLLLLPVHFYAQPALTDLVNPFIGTGGHGHTFPGAVLPFGMVQLSPDTRIDGSWDGCSGYHYSDSIIYGFSHTHLSGTGCSDWGDVMLMPMKKDPILDNKFYSSAFSHAQEKASPGYYQVYLKDEKINAELTSTLRTGIHRYTFSDNGEAHLLLDLLHRDKLLKGNIKLIDSVTAVGFRISEAWAREQHCYFAIKFSSPVRSITLSKSSEMINGSIFNFNLKDKELNVKVGISSVNEEGALANLNLEAPHWDFDRYKNEAKAVWNKQLAKITVEGGTVEKRTIFYTALYHCFIHPSLAMDAESMYRGRDNSIHTSSGNMNYSVFSLWDTYRALHPLFTLIERERTRDFINTFLNQFQQSKRLPVWELSANETDCMIGYHSVSVITDAMMKGISGLDEEKLFTAMKVSSTYSGFGVPAYSKKNYLDVEDEPESVSRTLEYAYDDWCIAKLALKLNKKEDYAYYIKRAQSYKNVFDFKTGFMRPRKNGNWLSPFDPKEVNNHFTEGNSWQYSFYVPQDIDGLIALHGGRNKFETKLDSLFSTSSKTSGRDQADITGLIGQYAHGNEPSHHMAYLYNYVQKPEKTQKLIEKIANEFYKNSPDGLIGNEDCGQMSAWYVFSALGFYPVCPGSTEYVIGKPLFPYVSLQLEDGKKFIIHRTTSVGEPNYIKSMQLNGKESHASFINHETIMNGGELVFSFEEKISAENKFGKGPFQSPSSKIVVNQLVPTPVIKNSGKSFKGKQIVTLESNSTNSGKIVYTLDGTEPSIHSTIYKSPITIDKTCTLYTKMYFNGDSSSVNEAVFVKRPNNWNIKLKYPFNKQYTAGGAEGVIDGIYGNINWRKGEWQGYQKSDFECIIDLNAVKSFSSISADFLQDSRSWILFPKELNVSISNDGKNFKSLESVPNNVNALDETISVKKLERTLDQKVSARFVKITAKNYGELPEGHLGHGERAFIFIDEIEIK